MIGIDNIFEIEVKVYKIMFKWFLGVILKFDIFGKKFIF